MSAAVEFFQMPNLICCCGQTPIDASPNTGKRREGLAAQRPYIIVRCSDMDCEVKGEYKVFLMPLLGERQ